jgi:hypothetical protein
MFFMAFSYGLVLARLRGLLRQAALQWNAQGRVTIADSSIPGPQLEMRYCPFGKLPKPPWQRQLLECMECFRHGDHVLNSFPASLLIHVPSRAQEPS